MTLFKSLGTYRAFSLTWLASMLIHWNKRKFLHKKRVQFPQGCVLVLQHGRRFIVLEHQYGRRDVMRKRSIYRCPTSLSDMCLHWSECLGLGLGMSSCMCSNDNAGVHGQSHFWFSQLNHRLNVRKLAPVHVSLSRLPLLILTWILPCTLQTSHF